MESASNDINNINNININIIDNPQQNQNQFSNNFGNSSLSFPLFCTFCKKTPIFPPIFYCTECKYVYCSQCEEYNGYKHAHALYKIRNTSQYEFLSIGKKSNLDQFIDTVGDKVENTYKSVLNFFGLSTDDNSNNQGQGDDINNPYNNQNRI